jgi:hypothetical protein
MPLSIIDSFGIPRELSLDFLATFARFEYALKRTGYVRGDETRAEADWDRFAKALATLDGETLAPVIGSCQYLSSNPPRKHILVDGALGWGRRRGRAGSNIEEILLDVRTVRNNVFHGGKFGSGPLNEPLRDEQLIRDCTSVLWALLALPLAHSLADYFMQP